ncbi:MAG: SRPBCC family protein [Blastocatellales bacterium]
MFDPKERTWIERTGLFEWKPRKSLKRELRNWAVMNLLFGDLGRIGPLRSLRRKVVMMGLSRIGSTVESAVRSRLRRRRQPAIVANQALTVGAALGAGAGLMYLFDPDRGASRRATLKGGAIHAINKTSSAAGATSRDLANRARGFAAQAGSIFSRGDTDDQTLDARVRSKLGRVVSHPGAIEVTTRNGHVTLAGDVLAHEVDDLLSRVRSVSGVHGLDNRLRIHSKAGDMPNLQGGQARRGARFELMQSNWSPAARLLTTITGGALMGMCIRRRDALGIAAGTLGFGLMMRGVTNIETRRLIGVGGGRRAINFHKTINIDAPVERVFEFWKNPANFPHFMTNVREVRDLGDGRSQWTVAGPAGVSVKWNAMVTEFVPNEVIAWKSEPGSAIANAGIIRFEPGGGGARVTVRMSYNPPAGAIGHAIATIFGANPKREMDQDLLRMKTMIETGHTPHDAAQPVRETSYNMKPTRGAIIH